jgi:hypothetical protein
MITCVSLATSQIARFNFSLLYARAVGWGDSDPDTHERLISFVGGGSGYHCVWLVGVLGVGDRPAVGACDSLILLTRQAEGREREGLTTHTLQDHTVTVAQTSLGRTPDLNPSKQPVRVGGVPQRSECVGLRGDQDWCGGHIAWWKGLRDCRSRPRFFPKNGVEAVEKGIAGPS